MNYKNSEFLTNHIKSILDFYDPVIVDDSGGFYQNFLDDGTVFDPDIRHLVSSTRIVFNYCKAFQLLRDEECLRRAKHGLNYLREAHWDSVHGGYNWILKAHRPEDQTNYCYGLAFVVLAFATALETGVDDTRGDLDAAVELMEKHFWLAQEGLYADEATSDWAAISAYRGQNANMHSCEATLAAFEATGEGWFLDRAYQLAVKFCQEMAAQASGLIWEHYTQDLVIDWEYNKDDPKNLYRPWGFQVGHQTEWAKLLLILHDHRPEPWMVEKAKFLFDSAVSKGWDETFGGLFYGFAPDASICDDEKYFWVQAESLAAAARLAIALREDHYWRWYERIWRYADQHMIDHRYGAWYRVLSRSNERLSDQKSIAGGKCDYHTLGACCDVLRAMQEGQE
jgi:mannose/cellobiose epimerase-like protein (N-acyl-D-glucosamine 2-epimerase family)